MKAEYEKIVNKGAKNLSRLTNFDISHAKQ